VPFRVIIEGNFKMKNSVLFVKIWKSFITSLLLELPNKNGVVERKNRSLDEFARTILSESSLPKYLG